MPASLPGSPTSASRCDPTAACPRFLDGVGYLSLAFAGGCLLEQLPHPATWITLAALTGSAIFGVWESAKAPLRGGFGHR